MAGRAGHQDDSGGRADRAREVGLFRYALIREAADPALSAKARGHIRTQRSSTARARSNRARRAATGELPGQLDLTDLTDDLSDDDSEGQR